MNREKAFNKILKYFLDTRNKRFDLVKYGNKIGIPDKGLVKSICKEMIEKGWAEYHQNNRDISLTYEGRQIIEVYGSYSSFLRSENKRKRSGKLTAKLTNIKTVITIITTSVMFVIGIYKIIIDNKKIKSQHHKIELLEKTIDSLKGR